MKASHTPGRTIGWTTAHSVHVFVHPKMHAELRGFVGKHIFVNGQLMAGHTMPHRHQSSWMSTRSSSERTPPAAPRADRRDDRQHSTIHKFHRLLAAIGYTKMVQASMGHHSVSCSPLHENCHYHNAQAGIAVAFRQMANPDRVGTIGRAAMQKVARSGCARTTESYIAIGRQ